MREMGSHRHRTRSREEAVAATGAVLAAAVVAAAVLTAALAKAAAAAVAAAALVAALQAVAAVVEAVRCGSSACSQKKFGKEGWQHLRAEMRGRF